LPVPHTALIIDYRAALECRDYEGRGAESMIDPENRGIKSGTEI